jgi:hypothetical protein
MSVTLDCTEYLLYGDDDLSALQLPIGTYRSSREVPYRHSTGRLDLSAVQLLTGTLSLPMS